MTLPLRNPWRKTSRRYWGHLLTNLTAYPRCWAQRARRGYSYADVWNFDSYLAQVVAGGLRGLAESGHAMPSVGSSYYPPDVDWGNEDIAIHETAHAAWTADLIITAEKLERYVSEELISWEVEQQKSAEAKEAMMWVAENLGSLWD